MATYHPLPRPPFYNPVEMEEPVSINYPETKAEAIKWRKIHKITPAATDRYRVAFLGIDIQRTFCLPIGELFVAGKSGRAAIDDSIRTGEFLWKNFHIITRIHLTMDTHNDPQIFSEEFWVDGQGNHPAHYTKITVKDLLSGAWSFNPAYATFLTGVDDNRSAYAWAKAYTIHYARQLQKSGRYELTIWPPHAQLGGENHALVPGIERLANAHQTMRCSPIDKQVKGGNPWTENYSVLHPEVLLGQNNEPIDQMNDSFLKALLAYDMIIIAGQAASHCVAWTIDDLLSEIESKDSRLAQKVYILKDCTSAIVVPGVYDYTDETNAAFDRFQKAGMHLVESTTPINKWNKSLPF